MGVRDFNAPHCELCGIPAAKLCDMHEQWAWRRADVLCRAASMVSMYPERFDVLVAVERAHKAVQLAECIGSLMAELYPSGVYG
jgi:hypothetical protein